MLYQELNLLRDAVFPYLLCTSAREGSIDALEKLRHAVSCSADQFNAWECYMAFVTVDSLNSCTMKL